MKKIACIADDSEKAQNALKALLKHYKFSTDPKKADVIIALGGDGFMLHTIHDYMNLDIPIYGMNCGTIGFLMNSYRENDLLECISSAKAQKLRPLHMIAKTRDGKEHHHLAINEVSMLRSSKQAAHLRISVDGKVRMHELVCDGVLCATPAGSTAYNLSVHGPIIPIGSGIMALTPISPFRPRRWRGALLSHNAKLKIDVIDQHKRPVNAVADFNEVEDVVSVEIMEEKEKEMTLLFDSGHSLEERIIGEQFVA